MQVAADAQGRLPQARATEDALLWDCPALRCDVCWPAQTYLEDGRFCLTCHFNDVPTKQAHAPFVNHFASCQMCAVLTCL